MAEKDRLGRTPAQERADIGTPAGEPPEAGRQRHETEVIHPDMTADEVVRRGTVGDEINEEDFAEGGNEIGTTGGVTGTHVTGGIPPGGAQSGGTPGEPEEEHSGDYK